MRMQWLFSTWQKTIVLAMLFAVGIVLWPQKTNALSTTTLVSLTNAQRADNGLPALHHDDRLATSAAAKARHMITNDYWAHTAPDGTSPWTFVSQAGYAYVAVGENLAKGFSADSSVISSWMGSPTHRANMLNPKFRDIGIAVVSGTIGGKLTTVIVAHYGATASVTASAPKQTAPSPEPVSTKPSRTAPVATKHKPLSAPVPVTGPAVKSQPPAHDAPAKKPYELLIERLVGYIANPDKKRTVSLVLAE